MKGQKWRRFLLPFVLAALSVSAFVLDLATYQAHADSGGSRYVSILILIICLIGFSIKTKQREKAGALMYLAVMLLSVPLILLECKIPFCPMCDGVSADDLGFLSRWIPTDP